MWNCFPVSQGRYPVFATSNFCWNLTYSREGGVLETLASFHAQRFQTWGVWQHSFSLCHIPTVPPVFQLLLQWAAPHKASQHQFTRPGLLSCSDSRLLPRQLAVVWEWRRVNGSRENPQPMRFGSWWITIPVFPLWIVFLIRFTYSPEDVQGERAPTAHSCHLLNVFHPLFHPPDSLTSWYHFPKTFPAFNPCFMLLF